MRPEFLQTGSFIKKHVSQWIFGLCSSDEVLQKYCIMTHILSKSIPVLYF